MLGQSHLGREVTALESLHRTRQCTQTARQGVEEQQSSDQREDHSANGGDCTELQDVTAAELLHDRVVVFATEDDVEVAAARDPHGGEDLLPCGVAGIITIDWQGTAVYDLQDCTDSATAPFHEFWGRRKGEDLSLRIEQID